MAEAAGLEELISDGSVKDILYGIPVSPSVLPALDELSGKTTVRLLIDGVDHVKLLSKYARMKENQGKPWSVFIKLDLGSNRAGVPLHSPSLRILIREVEASPAADLFGFYSYPARGMQKWSLQTANTVLREHSAGLKEAARLADPPRQPFTLAIGSSITARVLENFEAELSDDFTFEIIAGTAIYNDLQQLATNTIESSALAMTVIAEVCSVYPERNEALINAGVLALTREPGDFEGIARVRNLGKQGWIVSRVSQEHGILTSAEDQERLVQETWRIGDKVELDIQHTCIVGAMFGWHFITDELDIVREIYYPWKWW